MKNANETKANKNQVAAEINDEALDAVNGGIKKKIEYMKKIEFCNRCGSAGPLINGRCARCREFIAED